MEFHDPHPPMDERLRKRRQSVRWQRGRGRRTVLLLAALVVCSTVAFLCLRSTDVFDVRRIIATGTDTITQDQLAQITSPAVGESLLALSTDEIVEALTALPYVESARVIRSFPHTLEVRVVEYRPVARLQTVDGDTWLVSDSGRVLADTDPGMLPDLPLLVPDAAISVEAGSDLPAVIADVLPLAQRLRAGVSLQNLPPVANIAISPSGCAALVLEDGGEVRLGSPQGWERKLEVAMDIVGKCVAQGRIIEYVDASVINRVAVKAK